VTPGAAIGGRGADGDAPRPLLDEPRSGLVVRALARLGRATLRLCEELGGICVLLVRVLLALLPVPRLDRRELWRNLYKMGVQSVPIVALTAVFVGGIMVIQAGMYVRRFNAYSMVGWGAGYSIFREVGPILIGLMFSGRVGSNNTAELGTMVVTEQIDGLRSLAIDPVRYLLVPRVLSMVLMSFLLCVIGNLVAIAGGMVFARLMLGIDFNIFYVSFVDNLKPWDMWHGLIKSVVFGGVIALSSCHFGLSVRGGAVGVGRAVNAAVVSSAVGIMVWDYFLTYLLK
jgi:phospholipid/cholesterol/gamma-HCH transport system permease protein